MTKRKRPKKASRLEPVDVLRTRMEYYNGLARAEMKKGELGSREKIDEFLKLAQDAAKELGPYRHGKAQAGEDDEVKKNYVAQMGPSFRDIDEWLLYFAMVIEKETDEKRKTGFVGANERLIERFFKNQKPATSTLN